MKSSKILKWILVFGVMAAMVGGAYQYQSHRDGTAASTDESRSPPSNELVCQGYVDLLRGVTLLAVPPSFRVQEVLVAENDRVATGQPLLRFDDAQAREVVVEAQTLVSAAEQKLNLARRNPEQHNLQLRQQQAAVDGMQANLEVARHREALHRGWYSSESQGEADKTDETSGTESAKKPDEVTKESADKPLPAEEREAAIAKEQVKAAEAALAAEQAKLDALRLADPAAELELLQSEVDRAQAKLRQVEIGLEQCELRAPEAGTVLRLLVRQGQMGPIASAVYFAPDEERVVRVEIEQAYVDQVAAGCSVDVYEDRQPDRLYRGHVLRLSQWYSRPRTILEETSTFADVRTVECVIAFDADMSALRIGERVWARIQRAPPRTANSTNEKTPANTSSTIQQKSTRVEPTEESTDPGESPSPDRKGISEF